MLTRLTRVRKVIEDGIVAVPIDLDLDCDANGMANLPSLFSNGPRRYSTPGAFESVR
jgi:hypothetical protein